MKVVSDVKLMRVIQRIKELLIFGTWPDKKEGVLFAVGNGTSSEDRSNAFEVLNDSIVVCGQTLTAQSISDIATKTHIEEYINSLGAAEGVEF